MYDRGGQMLSKRWTDVRYRETDVKQEADRCTIEGDRC